MCLWCCGQRPGFLGQVRWQEHGPSQDNRKTGDAFLNTACSCGASNARLWHRSNETKTSSEPFVASFRLSRTRFLLGNTLSHQTTAQSARVFSPLCKRRPDNPHVDAFAVADGCCGKVRAGTGCITTVQPESLGFRAQGMADPPRQKPSSFSSRHACATGPLARDRKEAKGCHGWETQEPEAKCASSCRAACAVHAACSLSGNAWLCDGAQRRELSLCVAKLLSTWMACGKADRFRPLPD